MISSNTDPAYSHLSATSARRLTPEEFRIQRHEREQHLLECFIASEQKTYPGVTAVLLFPISHPRHFISLRYIDDADKECEIGIIEKLDDLEPEQQGLIQERLVRHYHEQVVQQIVSIKQRYGQLFFKVITQRGHEEFVMPWRQDRAEDWGNSGKVLLDSLNNRYLIPDIEKLSNKEKRMFKTHVYW